MSSPTDPHGIQSPIGKLSAESPATIERFFLLVNAGLVEVEKIKVDQIAELLASHKHRTFKSLTERGSESRPVVNTDQPRTRTPPLPASPASPRGINVPNPWIDLKDNGKPMPGVNSGRGRGWPSGRGRGGQRGMGFSGRGNPGGQSGRGGQDGPSGRGGQGGGRGGAHGGRGGRAQASNGYDFGRFWPHTVHRIRHLGRLPVRNTDRNKAFWDHEVKGCTGDMVQRGMLTIVVCQQKGDILQVQCCLNEMITTSKFVVPVVIDVPEEIAVSNHHTRAECVEYWHQTVTRETFPGAPAYIMIVDQSYDEPLRLARYHDVSKYQSDDQPGALSPLTAEAKNHRKMHARYVHVGFVGTDHIPTGWDTPFLSVLALPSDPQRCPGDYASLSDVCIPRAI